MKQLSSDQIRRMFLDYFAQRGHMIEPGASLVPHNDPTLLWINAGVAALKKYRRARLIRRILIITFLVAAAALALFITYKLGMLPIKPN